MEWGRMSRSSSDSGGSVDSPEGAAIMCQELLHLACCLRSC
jgi:hypothetical protein